MTTLAPTWSSVPKWKYTLGPEVAEVNDAAGFTPDANQAAILDAAFGFDRHGLPVADEVAIIAPRQNIKTGVEKMIAIGWLHVLERKHSIWSAHEASTATEAFIDLKALHDEDGPGAFLGRRVKRIYEGDGRQHILLKDGRRLVFRSRTRSGGRGLTGDDTMLDEAFALRAMHMGALLPTMLTRPEAQVVYGSSAGMHDSDILFSLRERGRSGSPRLAYFEWGDEHPGEGCVVEDCDHALVREGCALDDRERWWATNPTLGDRITEESIAKLRRSLPPEEFARECLGWWDEPSTGDPDLTVEAWSALAGEAAPVGSLILGIDAAPGHASASIVVTDGVDCELPERRPGVAWLAGRLVELRDGHSPSAIAFDPAGPIGSLVPDLEQAGLVLTPVEGKDSVRACGALVRLVNEAAIRHRGEPEFAAAVAGLRLRAVGDGKKFSRRDSTVDISPIVALAVALWVARRDADYDVLDSVY